jgi:hypothetical protein
MNDCTYGRLTLLKLQLAALDGHIERPVGMGDLTCLDDKH